MMLYEGDIRRCRRCKRRRMDDEPPEVQQYKTCAKCRIIERTKKKSRKPLAEETMRYGMRQFQEQNQTTNFIHDDIFTNDQLILDMSSRDVVNPLKQLYNAQFSAYKQPSQAQNNYPGNSYYNGQPLPGTYGYLGQGSPYPGAGGQPGRPQGVSSTSAAAIAAAAINRNDLQPQRLHQYRQYQQKGDRSRVIPPTSCELCSGKLDADDSISSIYRLCDNCYLDPYAGNAVLSDFNDFLLAVGTTDNVTYILELAAYLVELLNTNRPINSEQQFRKVMLDSFRLIYVDPLLASLAPLKLVQTQNNVGDVNATVPEVSKVSHQYHYTLTPPLKATYASVGDSGTTMVEVLFVTETNLIVIKKTSKKTAADYLVAFLKDLEERMESKGLTFDDDAARVYSELALKVDVDQFIKDFKGLEKVLANVRTNEALKESEAEAEDGDGGDDKILEDEEEEEEEEDEEEEQESESYEDKVKDDDDDEDDDEDYAEGEDPDDLDPAFGP